MARLTEDEKKRLNEEIRNHLLIDGPRNWDRVRRQFKRISDATFWRAVREVRESLEKVAIEEGPGAIREIQKRIRERVANPNQVTEKVKAHLPVAPSPAVVAADPHGAMQAFDFFAFFSQLVSDTMLARDSFVKRGEDGKERIVNPAMFDKNLSQRRNLLNTYTQAYSTIYNVERLRDLYDVIIEAIGEASPEVQQAVLAKLRDLNSRAGLTMAARP